MKSLRIIPLGGATYVTRNMFVYELWSGGSLQDILIVDCGIGFPDESMHGVDYLVPDISYLRNKLKKIRGLILTHGHMDHIAALKYLLPELKTKVYGTRLTSALAEADLRDAGLNNKVEVVDNDRRLSLGGFSVSFVHVTHSIPDAANLIIDTPVGPVYHGSDYKFDWTPVDQRMTEVDKIVAGAGKDGYLCLLSDCVRSENAGYTLSEQIIASSLHNEISLTDGKFIFATFSSNISRIQQAIDAALNNNRKICFSGRSMKQNVEVAKRLKYLHYPNSALVKERELNRFKDEEVALIVTGSQGEPGSALSRIGHDEHRYIKVGSGDKIVFSADPIPGNETAVNTLINLLSELSAEVVYTDIHDALHVSGHASRGDLSLMLALTKPRYIVPIGGEYKQMLQFKKLAEQMGHKEGNIFMLEPGRPLRINEKGSANLDKRERVDTIMVDGLGIGDVGTVVLRDREQLSEEGFVVAIVPIDIDEREIAGEVDIVTRGFVFRHDRDSKAVIREAKKIVSGALHLRRKGKFDWGYHRKKIIDELENFFYRELERRPLIVPVLVEV